MSEEQIIINKTEKASSFEFGPTGNRFKLYFETPEELLAQINKLKELGIIKDG